MIGGEARSTFYPGAQSRLGPLACWEVASMRDELQVSRVIDLVSYQADAIVSRILLKRDAGNVTLFAFDAGQELSEHTAPYTVDRRP